MNSETVNQAWSWPLHLAQYDRSPELTAKEKDVLHNFVKHRQTGHKRAAWFSQMKQAIPRLVIPLCDAYDFLDQYPGHQSALVAVFLQKMHTDQVSYWALTSAQWMAFFQEAEVRAYIDRSSVGRYMFLSILYLLDLLSDWRWAKKFPYAKLAQKVFGEDVFQAALARVSQVLRAQDFSEFCATGSYLPLVLGLLFLNRRQPYLEGLSRAYLQEMYDTTASPNHRAAIRRLACARCDFYVPKQSSRGSLLEAKSNLERMLQEIQLSTQEQAAVADGVLVMEKLLAQLVDVPTPAGPAPRQIAMNEGFLVTEETQG